MRVGVNDFGEESIPSWCIASGTVPQDYPNLGTTWWSDSAKGWPMFAMRSRAEFDLTLRPNSPSRFLRKVQWGIEAKWMTGRNFPVFLPLRPIWRGFIFDMTLYAALAFGLITVATFTRRRLRRSRRQCVECGYRLQEITSSNCPECGTRREPMKPSPPYNPR